jgi:hypothetical protein
LERGARTYTISDIAVGTYAVTATPTANSGYQPTTIHDVTISADTTLNFALVPATCSVEVAGVVRDSAGTPVPGLRVAASCGSSVVGQ